MVRQRLLAAEAAAAVIISLLVLSMDLANNGGSLSASTAPEVFFAKNSSLGSELHARDPGTAHDAGNKSFPGILFILSCKNIWIQAKPFFSFQIEIDD